MTSVGLDVGATRVKLAWRTPGGEPALLESRPAADSGAAPVAAAAGFLRSLSEQAGYGGQPLLGPGTEVVLAVPERWRGDPAGVAALRGLLADELGLTVRRLVGEPVAAAVYLLHRARTAGPAPQVPAVLVCNAGGSAFEAALCAVEDGTITLLALECDVEPAGRALDARVAQLVHRKLTGREASPGDPALARLLVAVDDLRRAGQDEVGELLELGRDDPLYEDTPVLVLDECRLTVAELRACFGPLGEPLRATLRRLRQGVEQAGHGALLAEAMVAVVGGFARFPLVEAAALAELRPATGPAPLLEAEERAGAAAFGALLVAEGAADPVRAYPHLVRAATSSIQGGRLVPGAVTLADPSTLEVGGFLPVTRSEPATVQVEATRQVVVEVDRGGGASPVRLSLPPDRLPRVGAYHLGVSLDPGRRMAITFQPLDGAEPVTAWLNGLAPDPADSGRRP